MQLKSFIERPVLSSVISILIVVAGVIGLTSLPIEQYPDIAPPTVNVSTYFYGASAATIQSSVLAPLEDAINGVENMTYMVSTADNTGMAQINVFFKQGVNPDMAAVNVQTRVQKAMSQLPAEVTSFGVTTLKRQTAILQIFAISSPDDRYDSDFLDNYLNINIKPKLLRINGVGDYSMLGSDYSMRIWLDPKKMQGRGLDAQEVLSALKEQNVEAATGSFGENSNEQIQYQMVYRGRYKTIEEFENIVIRVDENGEVLHLGDVAKVELGVESYSFTSKVDGHPGAIAIVYQTAGSNATWINDQIAQLLEEEKANMPAGVKIDVLMNTNDFLYASMHEVIKTLLEAIVLVILIVLLFLHDLRSTFIPFIGIMVSLIGTFAFMMLVGFSLNLITLFALVLVIGTVVDDAIVVVEAVHEKLDQGYTSSFKASVDAMSEITTAIITSSLVFMAVFIPVSFMGGTSGVFFRQFGLTMAVAVGISALNALTLSPALCALLIKPKNKNLENLKGIKLYKAKFSMAFNSGFDKMALKYQNGIKPLIKHPWTSFVIIAGFCAIMIWTMTTTPSGFIPQEDKSQIMVDILMPPSTSKAKTSELVSQIAKEVAEIPDIECVGQSDGYSFSAGNTSDASVLFIRLKPWEERDFLSYKRVQNQIYEIGLKYEDATVIPFQLPMINGYGSNSDAEINLQDKMGGSVEEFAGWADKYVAALQERPEIKQAYKAFNIDNPQWLVDIDVAKCHQMGLTTTQVLNSLATFCGSTYTNDINLFGKVYKVMVEAAPEYRLSKESLNSMYVRTPSGEMAPISTFVTLTRQYGSASLKRFNLLNSIVVNASPADGASSGDVIKAAKEVEKEVFPKEYTLEFGGMSREESGGGSMGLIFGISAFLIFLILAALYESYILPFSIILTVPVGIAGAFLATKIFGMENNLYLQVGVVMLIGLIAKTGILITEFAVTLRKKGMPIEEAALEAARLRLRPILMTAGTMIIGLLPLLISSGAGAVGNRSLGVGVVFGMLIGSIGLLLLVPALFVVFEKLQEKIKPLGTADGE